MSRLDVITIAIVIVCLAALGYLVYKIVNLVNPPEETTTSLQDSYANDTGDDTYTDWNDEASSTDTDTKLDNDPVDSYADTDSDTNIGSASGTYNNDEMDNASSGSAEADNLEEEEEEAAAPPPATNNTNTVSAPSNSGSGAYMVVAGSYRQRINADNQVARLQKLGYNNAQVKLFDNGTYALVLVDRFNGLRDAQRLVGELKDKGVDSFVKKKR